MNQHDLDKVLYVRQDNIALISLNNPQKANPIDVEVCSALFYYLAKAEEDEQVKVVVLEGKGSNFSAGGDLDQIREFLDSNPAEVERSLEKSLKIIERIYNFPKPMVAKLQGTSMGGGCALALACDFVVAAESARLGFVFINLGIVPDLGTMYLLPKLIGLRRAKELCYLGKTIDASKAVQLGLVNVVVPETELDAAVMELAQELSGKSLYPLMVMKSIMQRGENANLKTVLELESKAQALVWSTGEARQRFEKILTNIKGKDRGV